MEEEPDQVLEEVAYQDVGVVASYPAVAVVPASQEFVLAVEGAYQVLVGVVASFLAGSLVEELGRTKLQVECIQAWVVRTSACFAFD